MYRTFAHTADVGIEAEADSLESLFCEMAKGLFSLLVEDLHTVRPRQSVSIQLPPDETEFLLFDWLNELLYQFDAHRLVFSQFQVALEDDGLEGLAQGEPFDESRHTLSHEVKAITYHELRIWRDEPHWHATVIVDI